MDLIDTKWIFNRFDSEYHNHVFIVTEKTDGGTYWGSDLTDGRTNCNMQTLQEPTWIRYEEPKIKSRFSMLEE